MNNLIFIHTFWSKPAFTSRWNIDQIDQIIKNIWYYSLSALYVKHLSHKIELHTDDFGKMCLDHIPYDNIYLTLNTIPDVIQPYSWVFGKFWALQYCTLNSAHIDGDVFIKSNSCIETINELIDKGCDGVFQNIEHTNSISYPIYNDDAKILLTMEYPSWGDRHGTEAYNTGFLLFNSEEYKSEFLNNYFKCHKEIGTNDTIASHYKENKHMCPDLVIEQQFIYDLAQYKNFEIGTLLRLESMRDDANKIGYQHIIGHRKYDDYNIKKLKMTLYKLDPDMYKRTHDKCKQIYNYLNEKNIKGNLLRS